MEGRKGKEKTGDSSNSTRLAILDKFWKMGGWEEGRVGEHPELVDKDEEEEEKQEEGGEEEL